MRKTLVLAVLATLIGCVIGFICGILQTIPCSKQDNIVKRFFLMLIRVIIRIYVEVFRGTPMILQAVFIYYGLPYFTGTLVKWSSIFVASLVVVSINTGAYMAESVRGGFLSIDPGQTEGAKAIGMTHVQTMLYVIIPQALRVLLPQIGNNLIINIKDTSVMFIIGYGELFSVHRAAVGATYLYFPSASIEMVAYLTMTLIASLLLRLLEKAMDGSSNYNLVAVDQLVTAAGTYNHPGKGSPSDERNPEAVKSMMREEVRRQAEQEAARQKGKVATVRRENTNSDQRGDL
jgi:putative lysine transport system permease protein